MLKLGPLILIVNLFFSISAIAESKYAENTKDIIRGELRKFIFSDRMEILPKPLILDANGNMVEIGYKENILKMIYIFIIQTKLVNNNTSFFNIFS